MKQHFIQYLKMTVMIIFTAVVLTGVSACKNSELWDEMPSAASSFITQYFPMSELSSVSKNSTGYHVRIDNGPGLTFDSEGKWEAVDGYGMPLPQVMLFNELPPKFYAYLQEAEELNGVFAISRTTRIYTATLLKQTLTYEINTETITGTTPD